MSPSCKGVWRTGEHGTVTATAPTRTDGVVTLRAFRAADVDEIVAMGRDPESVRYT